jgi:phosphoribosylpyrophosphate synthetase
MRNQVDMANRLWVRASRVDSTNQAEWASAEEDLAADRIDLLMVPPSGLRTSDSGRPPFPQSPNRAHQAAKVRDAFEAVPGMVVEGAVLLVDDMVDSRGTLTECAKALRAAGSGPVFPLVLANSAGANDESSC